MPYEWRNIPLYYNTLKFFVQSAVAYPSFSFSFFSKLNHSCMFFLLLNFLNFRNNPSCTLQVQWRFNSQESYPRPQSNWREFESLCFIDHYKFTKYPSLACRAPYSIDSGKDFCRFSFLGYWKRNDFVPSCSQKNDQERCSFSVWSEKYTTRNDQKQTN